MAEENVLRSFVVSLGFKIDEAQFRRFQEGMQSIAKGAFSITKAFVEVGGALAITAKAADSTFQKVAKPMEGLFFAAQRLGSSASQIKTFQMALEQVGISAEETTGMIQSFANARASNPGLNAEFGLDPKQMNAAIAFRQALAKIEASDDGSMFARNRALIFAQQIGLGQEQYTTLWNNRQAIQERYLPQAAALAKKHPEFDANAAKLNQAEIQRRWTMDNADLTASDIAGNEAGAMGKLYGATDKLIDAFNRLNLATGGLAGESLIGAGLLATFGGALGGLKKIVGMLGGSGVAEGGAVAAEGTAGGLLSVAVSMVAPAVAAVVGSHYLDKWTKGTWWDTSGGAQDPGTKQPSQPQATGLADQLAWLRGKVQPMMSAVSAGLTDFVAGFEGHAKNGYGVYKDIGGHDTAGIGHLVKPGENLSGLDKQGALALLGRDLASATAAVKRMIHVALTGNQMKALTDFVFNLGAGNLEKSTLLKELNAGHYAAAAARFADYDKIFKNGHYVANEALARRRATEAETFRTPDRPNVTNNFKVNNQFEITSPDPQAAGDAVASRQARVHQEIVRNTLPAVS